jgi:hypothetical protein
MIRLWPRVPDLDPNIVRCKADSPEIIQRKSLEIITEIAKGAKRIMTINKYHVAWEWMTKLKNPSKRGRKKNERKTWRLVIPCITVIYPWDCLPCRDLSHWPQTGNHKENHLHECYGSFQIRVGSASRTESERHINGLGLWNPQPGNHRQNSPCERHHIVVAIVYTSLYAVTRKHRLWSRKVKRQFTRSH